MNDISDLSNAPKVLAWKQTVRNNGCEIRRISPLNIVRKKNGELLFALLDCDIRAPEGYRLPHIVFVRGDACLIVTLVRNRETGEERFLMVRQRRVGSGALCLEFPAGMLDTDIDDPRSVAAREIAEETGLSVVRADLFPLCDRKLYSSPGAADEAICFFGCIASLSAAEYGALAGDGRGNPDEGEHISVALVTREQAEAEADSIQVRAGFYLFEDYLEKNAVHFR